KAENKTANKTETKTENKTEARTEKTDTKATKTDTKISSNPPSKSDGKAASKTDTKTDTKTADKSADRVDTKPDTTRPAAPAPRPADIEAQNMENELGLAAIRTEPAAAPASCSLTVGSSPWAELWVDGKDPGHQTPVAHLQVDCGRHKLTFKRADLDIAHDV